MLSATLRDDNTVKKVIREESKLVLETSVGRIKLEPFCSGIVRIVYTHKEYFSEAQSLGVTEKQDICQFDFKETDNHIIFTTELIKIKICKKTCAFSYYDCDNNLLIKEPDTGGKFLEEFDIYKEIINENANVKKIQTPDGEKIIVESAGNVYDRKSYHTKLEFEFSEDEALYGLGQHEEGILNLRGTCQYLHQANLKIPMPFLLSTNGYGILVDTYSALTFHDDQYGSYLWTHADDEMDFYFIYGPSFDEIIKGYRYLTGTATMLPKWAFGYIQSQERYETQTEIIEIAEEYRRQEIPLDAIVLDWCSWEDGLWGQKTFDKSRFPDAKAMTRHLHNMGVKFMISIWPNMDEKSENYAQMKSKGCLLDGISTYNPFIKEARELYWKQANEGLFCNGVDAWWCDSNEPFTPEWGGIVKPEPEKICSMFLERAKTHIDEEYINAFPLMHATTIYEGQRGVTDDKRVVNLTRASYIGQQRYGTIMWSGDISASWNTLKKQIPAGLNYCVTGLPYWTLDIGAFFVKRGVQWFWNGGYNEGVNDLGYRELYVRWFQFGAFLPVFRAHGTDFRREVWQFGEKGEVFYDTLVKFINIRYSLMPYIYSMAGMVTQKHYTMLRLLAFDFAYDKNVYNIDDQYMFGDALLVCPVTVPMYYEKNSVPIQNSNKTRKVYLPEGNVWYDFWTNRSYNGASTIIADAPLEIMPIYVKSGSILPMGEIVQNTGACDTENLTLNIYSGSNGAFTLYIDQGDNYNYEKGKFATIDFLWDDKNKRLTVEALSGDACFVEKPYKIKLFLIDENGKRQCKNILYQGIEFEVYLS